MLQHDERHFRDAQSLIPERWLDRFHSANRADLVLDKRGFVPVSAGPMNCAGKHFAYMEIKVFVAKFLRQFRSRVPKFFLL